MKQRNTAGHGNQTSRLSKRAAQLAKITGMLRTLAVGARGFQTFVMLYCSIHEIVRNYCDVKTLIGYQLL